MVDIIGFVVFVKNYSSGKLIFLNSTIGAIKMTLIVFLWGIISYVFNGGGQMASHLAFIVPFFSFFGVYLIAKLTLEEIYSYRQFYWLIIIAIFVACLCSFLIAFSPGMYDLIGKFQEYQLGNINSIGDDPSNMFRLIGIGTSCFFGAYKYASLGLLLLTYMILSEKKKRNLIILIGMYFVITVSSLLSVRTSIIVVALSLIWFFMVSLRKNLGAGIAFIGLLVLVVWFVNSYLLYLLPDRMYTWALELFLSEEIGDTTVSTIIDWFTDFSPSLKTFLIGDSIYTNVDGTYYGHVDIGFLRRILYGGIIGLLLGLYVVFYMMKKIYHEDKSLKVFLVFLFLSFLGSLAKGDDSIDFQLLLLLGSLEYFRKSKKFIYANVR